MADRTPHRTPEVLAEPGAYSAPTGEEVEIPAGSTVIRNGDLIDTQVGKVLVDADASDGEIVFWHNPPQTPEGELHPSQVADYEPFFDRGGITRRVLMHVTDEVDDFKLGPRNSLPAITSGVSRDPNTAVNEPSAEGVVQSHLDRLINAGLIEQRDDGTYGVTDAGLLELRN